MDTIQVEVSRTGEDVQETQLPGRYTEFLRRAIQLNPKQPALSCLLRFMEKKSPPLTPDTLFGLRLSIVDFGQDSRLASHSWGYYKKELSREKPLFWWHGAGNFKDIVERGPPPATNTRVISVGIEGEPLFHKMFPELADVVEILGNHFDIEVLFFCRFVSMCLRKKEPLLGGLKQPHFLDLDMSTYLGGLFGVGIVQDTPATSGHRMGPEFCALKAC